MHTLVSALIAWLLLMPSAASLAKQPIPNVEHMVARWPDGGRRLEADRVDDTYHGEYRTWYRSGAPYELRHFVHGREEGPQQSWTEAGEVFLNYEVRGGRRYGFINATPCLSVEEPSR